MALPGRTARYKASSPLSIMKSLCVFIAGYTYLASSVTLKTAGAILDVLTSHCVACHGQNLSLFGIPSGSARKKTARNFPAQIR